LWSQNSNDPHENRNEFIVLLPDVFEQRGKIVGVPQHRWQFRLLPHLQQGTGEQFRTKQIGRRKLDIQHQDLGTIASSQPW